MSDWLLADFDIYGRLRRVVGTNGADAAVSDGARGTREVGEWNPSSCIKQNSRTKHHNIWCTNKCRRGTIDVRFSGCIDRMLWGTVPNIIVGRACVIAWMCVSRSCQRESWGTSGMALKSSNLRFDCCVHAKTSSLSSETQERPP